MSGTIKARQHEQSPLRTMQIGGFHFMPHKETKSVSPYVSLLGKQLGWKFMTHSLHMMEQVDGWKMVGPDHPYAISGVGIWRIA